MTQYCEENFLIIILLMLYNGMY